MSKKEAIIRYSLIVRKLRTKPSTFDEIYDFLQDEAELMSYNFDISKRTFQRDLDDIRSIFSLELNFDFSRKVYYIEEGNPANERLLEAFDMFNALNIKDRIPNALFFENRKPKGTELLHGLMHAITNNQQVKFSYKKHWEDMSTQRTINPYAIKEFDNRWYLVGSDCKINQIRIFGLDRVNDLNITNLKFNDPQFSIEEYFRDCFGIIRPDEADQRPEKVILSFDPLKGEYIKSLPLHSSQKVLEDSQERLLIELKVFITYDFVREILSHGNEVQVLEPEHLKQSIMNNTRIMLSKYEE
jgi:predicted DNA-binding transcriptional regulator YafY